MRHLVAPVCYQHGIERLGNPDLIALHDDKKISHGRIVQPQFGFSRCGEVLHIAGLDEEFRCPGKPWVKIPLHCKVLQDKRPKGF